MRITIAVAAAIAATSVSFAVATAANQQPAAQTSATDKAVVNQLKTLNRNVSAMNRTLGTNPVVGMRYELVKANRELADISEALGRPHLGRDITDLLYETCKNTNPVSQFSC